MWFADALNTRYLRHSSAVSGGSVALGAARDRHTRYGASWRRLIDLVPLALVAGCVVSFYPSTALADSHQRPKPAGADLRPLWSAFPLDAHRKSSRGQLTGSESVHVHRPL